MSDAAERQGYEDKSILQRLGLDSPWADKSVSVIGVIRPSGQAAVMRLADRGLVSWCWGEGKDAGVMLVRRGADGRTRPYPLGGGGGLIA